MKNTNTIHVVSCHAEGEVGDVIVGGVAPPPAKHCGISGHGLLMIRPCAISCLTSHEEGSSDT